MSTIIMSKCWPLQLPPTAKSVLISLADNANDHGYCWPSIDTIAERTCFTSRAVTNAIKTLESFGLLVADRSNGRHTKYQITVENYVKPMNDVHPCTTFTPEPNSKTPERGSPLPLNVVPKPLNDVHTNRKEPSLEPSKNRQVKEKGAGELLTFSRWSEKITALGEALIPADDPVFAYAQRVGIPPEFVALHWATFKSKYEENQKKYVDWRAVLRTSLRANWYKLWFVSDDGTVSLTTAGKMERKNQEALA